jgi:hypothetical protein
MLLRSARLERSSQGSSWARKKLVSARGLASWRAAEPSLNTRNYGNREIHIYGGSHARDHYSPALASLAPWLHDPGRESMMAQQLRDSWWKCAPQKWLRDPSRTTSDDPGRDPRALKGTIVFRGPEGETVRPKTEISTCTCHLRTGHPRHLFGPREEWRMIT